MSGTTSRFAFPYPSPADPLKEGAAKIKAFAEGADAAILNRSYGKSIIATEQSRENAAYGTLATPDEVELIMPQDGLIVINYSAIWKASTEMAGSAALFIGGSQIKAVERSFNELQSAYYFSSHAEKKFVRLSTFPLGLISEEAETIDCATDVTTGQSLGHVIAKGTYRLGGTNHTPENRWVGGPVEIFAAAGTYKITVQFKSSSGNLTVKNRKLWCWSMF